MTRELGTAHRQEKQRANRDHCSLSTTKIIKNSLVSVPRDDVAKQRALASCAMKDKEVEKSRNTKDSVSASFTQSKEQLGMHGDQRRRDRKVISRIRVDVKVLRASRHSLVPQHR